MIWSATARRCRRDRARPRQRGRALRSQTAEHRCRGAAGARRGPSLIADQQHPRLYVPTGGPVRRIDRSLQTDARAQSGVQHGAIRSRRGVRTQGDERRGDRRLPARKDTRRRTRGAPRPTPPGPCDVGVARVPFWWNCSAPRLAGMAGTPTLSPSPRFQRRSATRRKRSTGSSVRSRARSGSLIWISASPEFHLLDGEPRYQQLMRSMNLSPDFVRPSKPN